MRCASGLLSADCALPITAGCVRSQVRCWRRGPMRCRWCAGLAVSCAASMTDCSLWRRQLRLEFEDGSALTFAREQHGDVQLSSLPALLTVRFRHGGERLPGAGGHISLKQLLQVHAIPPWARAQVPLIAAGERIVAVADLWLHPAYRAQQGTRSVERGRLRWRRLD